MYLSFIVNIITLNRNSYTSVCRGVYVCEYALIIHKPKIRSAENLSQRLLQIKWVTNYTYF